MFAISSLSLSSDGGEQVLEVEGVLAGFANVVLEEAFLEEGNHVQQVFVFFFCAHVGVYGHSVGQVKGERQNGVVNNDHVGLLAVQNDVQVFDEELVYFHAFCTVHASFEQGLFWVNFVQDGVGVVLHTCGPDHDFVKLRQLF